MTECGRPQETHRLGLLWVCDIAPHLCALVAVALSFVSVLGAGGFEFVQMPLPLLAMSAILWVRTDKSDYTVLQSLIGTYLILVLVNEAMGLSFAVSAYGWRFYVSYGTAAVAVLIAGHCISRMSRKTADRSGEVTPWQTGGWIAAVAIIGVHMAFVSLLLYKCYGYGYGGNLPTLARILVFLFAYVALQPVLRCHAWRRVIAVVLAVFYGTLAVLHQ